MTEGKLSRRIVAHRMDWIQRMIGEIRLLPLASLEAFLADRRNMWAAESCLRRALEALLDLGRHILAKGFAVETSEDKEIARQLGTHGALLLSFRRNWNFPSYALAIDDGGKLNG